MLWMAFMLLVAGIGIGQMAHQRYHLQRQHQLQAIACLATSKKIKDTLDALTQGGCQLELLQIFNAYLTLNLAPMMALHPQHKEARQLAQQALLLAESKLSPSAQLATTTKHHKHIRNTIYYASRMLPQMVQCGILRKKKLRQWQVYLHHLLLEYELNYHCHNIQTALNAKRYAASGYHIGQAEGLLKKTPFMDAVLQKNWLSRLADFRTPLLNTPIEMPL
jgi:hypothetical protein